MAGRAYKGVSGYQKTHGQSYSRTYRSWLAMHQRCRGTNAGNFHNYAGRGIKVCDQWKSFEVFYADMGERPQGHSLDRIDNDKNYCLENCRWASPVVQHNNKRTNRLLTVNGVTKSVKDWARDPICVVSYEGLLSRLNKGRLEPYKALTLPLRRGVKQ